MNDTICTQELWIAPPAQRCQCHGYGTLSAAAIRDADVDGAHYHFGWLVGWLVGCRGSRGLLCSNSEDLSGRGHLHDPLPARLVLGPEPWTLNGRRSTLTSREASLPMMQPMLTPLPAPTVTETLCSGRAPGAETASLEAGSQAQASVSCGAASPALWGVW
ncbi:hypothetical protein L226DRAFT_153882 [Lentinus tigrinus ALCF2SS1-7]|uniref:uncharacterized protein n=1 Tax=Lentinus tigrinus ALCF2SS1-7 TaxID=1328758 RepID=UPI0011661AB4|nr:hypothetical protein L226DRAFT_153882 [Lentinus tigrinus ALCF2SS1-7]